MHITRCGQGAQGGEGGGGSGSGPSLEAALAQMGFDSVDEYQAFITTLSDGEAFVCACALLALLEAQP